MAATTASKRRQARREELREKLQGNEYLRQIHNILNEDIPADQAQVKKLKLDGYFKLLAKILPDVKAIEASGEDGGPLQVQIVRYSDTE